jgi:hypothetical protein
LRHPKLISCPKTLALAGAGNSLQSRDFMIYTNGFVMDQNSNFNQNKGGRRPKNNPSIHRHVFRLTDEENAKLLSLFESSGMHNKAKFIVSVLFGKEIKTVKIDKSAMDYYMRLTTLYDQFRAVGVNYNQIVKLLYRNFSERKAAAYLYKLEKQTAEMAKLSQEIIRLTQEFETKYLKKQK